MQRAALSAYLLGLAGASILAWIAGDALIGAPPPYRGPGDYGSRLHWTMSWLWFAPLPYAFAWFALASREIWRAVLVVGVLAMLTAVAVLPAAVALLVYVPLPVIVGVPVAILFGVVMAGVQGDVPPGREAEYRRAHVWGCLVALPQFSLVMTALHFISQSPGRAPDRLLHVVLPLAVLLAAWGFHAIWCWRLLPAESRATPQWKRVVALLTGAGTLAIASMVLAHR